MTTHYPCRCRTCGARRSLRMRPQDYLRKQPKCACGAQSWRIDKYRMREEHAKKCECGGYYFPHRFKSKYCYHNPQAEQHHTERYEHAARS